MPPTHARPFRFIYSGANDGYMNMAIDEAIMTGLKEHRSTPVLRIYKWDPPTITIGYFQNASDINLEECEKDGIGVVRRPTGGRAVLHSEELTYSILFTEEDFSPFKKKGAIHIYWSLSRGFSSFSGDWLKNHGKNKGEFKVSKLLCFPCTV